jgi:acetyltransferase
MKRKLKRLLNPKSIAIIGASEHPNKVGGILMQKLQKFSGKIIPINPNHKEIFNYKTYPSIINYPKKIHLAIIAIPAREVKKAVLDCVYKKIKNIIIISAGFKEVGNTEKENEILEIAQKNKMNLLGPNCFGVANPYINLDTTFSNKSPRIGDTAFISQSGALGSYIMDIKPLRAFVSLGNMADLSFNEFIEYFSKDKKTKKIVCYMETLKKGREFIEICKKSKKEIIVVKAGLSETGTKAAISHTGSLATDYEIYKGAFAQAKIKQVDSIETAFGIKSKNKIPKIKNPIIITNAGGAGALVTDYLESNNIKLNQQPIDILGTAQSQDYEKAIKSQKTEESIVVVLTPQKMSEPEKTAEMITNLPNKNQIICYFLGGPSVKKATEILTKNKVKVLNTIC